MARTITTYDLLLSCPGDVYDECFPVVKTAVDDFNGMYGQLYNVAINLTHWSTDSYPESGQHPQTLLNTQIVDPADAAIAIFWTRFGTPTDEYGSGTEEEIERMLSSGRQVFLYFLDKPIPASSLVDVKLQGEYAKVQALKGKYQSKGLYWVVNDEHDLKKKLTLHLAKHFLKAIESSTEDAQSSKGSQLRIVGVTNDGTAEVNQFDLLNTKIVEEKRLSIVANIKHIINNPLPQRSAKANEELENVRKRSDDPIMKISLLNSPLNGCIAASISTECKNWIEEFCKQENIEINSAFWNLGDLNKKQLRLTSPFLSNSDSGITGTDSEKDRYNLFEKIVCNILDFNDLFEFYTKIDKIPFIELAVQNMGTSFDQEVDVKLFFDKDSLLPITEFPLPELLVEEFYEDNTIDAILCPKVCSNFLEFSDYERGHFLDTTTNFPSINESASARIARYKKACRNRIRDLHYYSIFEEEDGIVLRVKFNEVRQHTGVLFPTKLFFLKIPDSIKYTIIGKYTPHVIQGELSI